MSKSITDPVCAILTTARDLIADPEHWTQNVYARTVEGNPISEHASAAHCFCSHGALNRAERDLNINNYIAKEDAAHLLQKAIIRRSSILGVAGFNDSRSHADVLEVFDEAIESCNK